MDPRVREHAEIIADHSVSMQRGDNVVVDASTAADDLVIALFEVIGERGANPIRTSNRAHKAAKRAYLRNHDGDFELSTHAMAMMEETDVYIAVRGNENVTEESDVPAEHETGYRSANKPILEERLGKRWVLTQFPAKGNAQLAGMSTQAYENFVWDAINKDWEEQRTFQADMVDYLEDADEVRIVSGETTDLTLSIAGNPVKNDHGQNNLPGGEVFTAPIPTSVEGTVVFDKPVYYLGREVTNARLVFEGGKVVDHSAETNEEVLTTALETDPGARRLGEVGIGMNRDIDRFTYNMLYDEKMGDTVHLAVGRAYDDTVGDGNEGNDSAIHLDMIVDMSENSRIELDGEVIQRDGVFVFEDGFEA